MLANTLMMVILGSALWRRPTITTILLLLSWLVSIYLSGVRQHEALRPLLMANDSILIVALWWARKWGLSDPLASVIASFSLVSVTVGLIAAAEGWSWNTYAATINGLAVAQAIFSGGFGDGLLAWLGHRSKQFSAWRRTHRGLLGGAR